MAPTWNPDILNRFIAPGIAQFTEAEIPEPAIAGVQAEYWMANHFLHSVFLSQYEGNQRQLAFNIIYRAQAAIEDHKRARELTSTYLESSKPENPSSNKYYRALRAWETCLLNLQAFTELVVTLSNTNIFTKGDDTPQEHAYEIANTIKHWGKRVREGKHHDDDTVPMWLTNSGFSTRNHALTYVNLADLLADCAVVANDLFDPAARCASNT
ncbi:hypothetical protein H5407_13930 [Mitsuaria sp. WAJ17]|uniref:hypothetical protein n=1 Tax=Mitsuaria sp. WAJ17 TaxID=2761452 RepID=UPI0016039CB3|nr:hypothetical protein [Mitsuaria sp. WAJ17]MBB2486318.1 hypothetical protein [Mitsuaria sp. WAJ17]